MILRDGRTGLDVPALARASCARRACTWSCSAYQTQVFLELRDVRRYRRPLGAPGRVAGRAGSAVGRRGDAGTRPGAAPRGVARSAAIVDAVREPRAGASWPRAGAGAAGTGRRPSRQIEAFVAEPAAATWRAASWIYDWQLDRVMPDADLGDSRLRQARRVPAPAARQRRLCRASLLRDERFLPRDRRQRGRRRAWFNKEKFEHAVSTLGLPRPAELRAPAEKSALSSSTSSRSCSPRRQNGRRPDRRGASRPPSPPRASRVPESRRIKPARPAAQNAAAKVARSQRTPHQGNQVRTTE